jgi:chromosome segregation ATPase
VDESNKNKPVLDEATADRLEVIYQLQRRQGRYIAKKVKKIEANIDVIRSHWQDTDREISTLAAKQSTSEKRISTLTTRIDTKENSLEGRELQLWRFVGSSEELFNGLKESLDKTNESLDTIKKDMVTKISCEESRRGCEKHKKLWYENIPILVSAITLLILVFTALGWLMKGPASIDPATAKELKQIIQNNKLKVNFDAADTQSDSQKTTK